MRGSGGGGGKRAGRRGYAVVTVLMLALAVGANVVGFGIFYGYDVKALPYRASSRIALVTTDQVRMDRQYPEVSAGNYWGLAGRLPAVAAAGLWDYVGPVAAEVAGATRQVDVARVTPSFLSTLGVRPVIGRLPAVAAGLPGGPHEAVISTRLWRADFGGRGDVLGQRIGLDGVDERIVGVMPARFGFVSATDLWVSYVPPRSGIPARNATNFMPVRLAAGATWRQLGVELRLAEVGIERGGVPAAARDRVRLVARPIRGALLGMTPFGDLPVLVQGMALLLLGLAIANAGNLALVRTRNRLPQFALRRMLGARRVSLVRLVVAELAPVLVGTVAAGAVIGAVGLRALRLFQPVFGNPPFGIAGGWPVYAAGGGLAVVAVLLVGVGPVVMVVRQLLGDRPDQGAQMTLSPGARRAQKALGALQVGLAAILLIGSAALSLSLHGILTQPRGFATRDRMVASVLMPPALARVGTLRRVVDAVSRLPGVRAAAGSLEWSYPLTRKLIEVGVFPDRAGAAVEGVYFVPMVGNYFRALGIGLRAGREFGREDGVGCRKELVVSRDLAGASFPGGAPERSLGKGLILAGDRYAIVGITPRLLWQPVGNDGISGTMFLPAGCLGALKAHFAVRGATVIVEARGGRVAMGVAIRRAVAAAVPGVVVTDVRPYAAVVFASTAFRAVIALVVDGFAVLAVVLAAIGVFAVNASIARARLAEFGVRAMLGAGPARLLRAALADAVWVLAAGLSGGAIGGYFLVRVMGSVLFRVGGVMPVIFAGSLGVIAVVVLGSAWRPAALAARMPVKRLLDAG